MDLCKPEHFSRPCLEGTHPVNFTLAIDVTQGKPSSKRQYWVPSEDHRRRVFVPCDIDLN